MALWPNPARRGVRVQIELPAGQRATHVEIYDIGGRMERRLAVDGAGGVVWDGQDEAGRSMRPGIHLIRPAGRGGALGMVGRLVLLH
jgi:hypothetical protein